MFYALREGLRIIAEEGLENRWARHRQNHLALVAGLEAMGLRMHVAEPHRLWTLNTPRVPEGVDDAEGAQAADGRSTGSRSWAASGRWPARSSASA